MFLLLLFLGLLSVLKQSSFVFNLYLFYDILQTINILSKKLQQKNTTLGNATLTINGVIQTFENMRNFSQYTCIWSKVIEFCSKHNINIETLNASKLNHTTYFKNLPMIVETFSMKMYEMLVFY